MRISRLEKRILRIGLLPLADAAPIIVAKARGLFVRHGLHVELSLEHSWATVRDKVATGVLDGAQMLAPMPVAAHLGLDGLGVPMITALSLNINGNSITVSRALFERMREVQQAEGAAQWAQALRKVIDADRLAGRPLLTFAHVYPFSSHHYELRAWLASAGIDPDCDVNLCVVPPSKTVDELEAGRIDGCCVGAPWGDVAVRYGIGARVASKHEIWNNSPEKVLGVTQDWAQANPHSHRAMIAALIEAARWLDFPEHRSQGARMMVEGGWAQVDRGCIEAALESQPGGLIFHRYAANFPWRSHAIWFALQMLRWKQCTRALDFAAVARTVYRSDIYREAAAMVGQPCPALDFKTEGLHAMPWTMRSGEAVGLELGADRLLDGSNFDPWKPQSWLRERSADWLPESVHSANSAGINMAR